MNVEENSIKPANGSGERKKKVSLYGEPGKNRAEVTEEDRETNTEMGQHAKGLIRQAGVLYRPLGSEYLGSAVVHFYKNEPLPSHPTYFVLTHVTLDGAVSEHHANVGYQQLKSALMKSFGRKEPKTRG